MAPLFLTTHPLFSPTHPQKTRMNGAPASVVSYPPAPQHFLYFLPLPQGQGSLRPILSPARTTCCTGARSPEPAMRACSNSRFLRRWKASSNSSTDVDTPRGGRRPLPSPPLPPPR